MVVGAALAQESFPSRPMRLVVSFPPGGGADLTARAVEPAQGSHAGVVVRLDGPSPQDKTPVDDPQTNPLSAGKPVFNFYSIEVVQRIGYDSFTPDDGVLIAKNKDQESDSCGYNCFTWVIDAHPEDIRILDFKRPNGEPVMRSIADYRQLNDALFHAGLDSGSSYEWEDAGNRLHFYVLDVHRDERGILSYQVGIRSLDAAIQQARALSIAPGVPSSDGAFKKCTFAIANTEAVQPVSPKAEKPGVPEQPQNDIVRLTAASSDPAWAVQLRNALAVVQPRKAAQVDVYFFHHGSGQSILTLNVQSESDPSKNASATCAVGD